MRIKALLISGLLALLSQPALAQSYPSETIKIIVPFAAGGNVDVTARLIAPAMSEILGQAVIVENRAGAGGLVGAGAAMSAKPDGHTLMMGSSSTLSVGPNVFPNWPHDPIKGITPITNIHVVPFALVVKADSPIKSAQDMIRLAKEKPGELTQAHVGVGSSNYLVSKLFMMTTGTKLLLVSYRGGGPAMNDLVGGQVQTYFDQASTTVSQVQGGTIRALAVTANKRMATLPDTPTFAEVGVKNFEVLNMTGLVGPAGLSPQVVAKVRDAVIKAVARPDVRAGFDKLGVELVGSEPKAFADFIKEDLDRWAKVVAEEKKETPAKK